ncbi:MAG TPA: prolyl oligopeptidase family serine peptidase [Candidatus Ratteibacteria bacterium]|nr:prolyl oligopeptidase family serine peptidase [Candidatus Ratteibacteria bacterium]
MRKYEITYENLNSESYLKPITLLVIEPDKINSETGIMFFTHGWGGNRFQPVDRMEYATTNFNVISISTEYRQSGFDFNSITGLGSYVPYDASFFQVFDVLNGLRFFLSIRDVNRKRIYHYGGSQGGHICLLSSIFAPDTFTFVYASSPIVKLTNTYIDWAGRYFGDYEISIRDVMEHANLIKCPVFLEHGTNDHVVPHNEHTEELVKELKKLGKNVFVKYYENGGHDLQPTSTRLEAFMCMCKKNIFDFKNENIDDFQKGSIVRIPAGSKTLVIDWSKKISDNNLFFWE